jgi:hypothetical protein
MVGETALEQHTDAMMTGKIGGSDQRDAFRYASPPAIGSPRPLCENPRQTHRAAVR